MAKAKLDAEIAVSGATSEFDIREAGLKARIVSLGRQKTFMQEAEDQLTVSSRWDRSLFYISLLKKKVEREGIPGSDGRSIPHTKIMRVVSQSLNKISKTIKGRRGIFVKAKVAPLSCTQNTRHYLLTVRFCSMSSASRLTY